MNKALKAGIKSGLVRDVSLTVGVDTETEVLSRLTWQFDAGSLLGIEKGTIAMGPGYERWYHKFGNPSPIPVPGSAATKPNHPISAPTFQAEIHF